MAAQPVKPASGKVTPSVTSGFVREASAVDIRPVMSVDVIDEAVEQVISDQHLQPGVADSMRRLMAVDMKSGAAHAYFTSMAGKGALGYAARSARKEMVLSYVLTDAHLAQLTAYAPEYNLVYMSRDVHDHPLAAACRLVDRDLVYSRLPLGGSIIDVGSAVMTHVLDGTLGERVHACHPLVDPKDPNRLTQDNLKVARVLEKGYGDAVVKAANAYLDRDPAAVCDKLVQQCSWQGDFIACVHVYDIFMRDWPAIIERHGAKVVEGVMLFSPRVFEERVGEFKAAGARYEVQADKDIFRMGFVNSAAWWYQHSWVEYLKYGVDQILVGKKAVYSYKIVERRGDTIFFRILPVAGKPKPDMKQVYVLPGVPMVSVSGFQVGKSDRRLSARRRVYQWPQPLWEDMLTYAKGMVDRGTLDYERLYNYYRTVAPRQTINAVCIAGGHTVDIGDLVPLIVHVALAATMGALKNTTEIQAHVGTEMKLRRRSGEWTAYKMLAAFGEALRASVGLFVYPLQMIAALIDQGAETLMYNGLMDWAPQVQVREISAKLVLSSSSSFVGVLSDVVAEDLDSVYRDAAPFDHIAAALADKELAVQMLAGFYDDLPADIARALEEVAGPDRVKVTLDGDGKAEKVEIKPSGSGISGPPPSYRTAPGSAVGVANVVEARLMAINEAIEQCEVEMRAVQSSLAAVWRETMFAQHPDLGALKRRGEEYRDAGYWWVENGIIVYDALKPNAVVSSFEHSAVFTMLPDPHTGSSLRPVFEESFDGMSEGVEVHRTYFKVSDSYTGWALTNSSVVVYNGPELVTAMRIALTKPMEFETRLVRGPPGCGKTFQICKEATPADCVFAPAKKICKDTQAALREKSVELAAVVDMRCRTVDSYLVNYTVSNRVQEMQAERLMADEAFMAASGRWWACAALLGASRVWFYGDEEQIEPIVRAGAPRMFLRVSGCDVEEKLYHNFRNPANAVAAIGGVYNWEVRAHSNFPGALLHVQDYRSLPNWSGQVMLGFYQADKKEMHKLYANLNPKPRIATVHEVQGETLRSVKLHRFDLRRRTDGMALFDRQPYVIVALSRHKENFAYVSPKLGDLVEAWVARGRDPRRAQAAADVDSAGESKEFI